MKPERFTEETARQFERFSIANAATVTSVLWVAKLAIQHAPAKEWLVEFQLLLNGKFHTLWATLDATSGPAIHILQPSEY